MRFIIMHVALTLLHMGSYQTIVHCIIISHLPLRG